MNTPAALGPRMRVMLLPAEFSAIAFAINSGPTTSGTSACRAGRLKANTDPCTSPAATRCQISMRPVLTSSAVTSVATPKAA